MRKPEELKKAAQAFVRVMQHLPNEGAELSIIVLKGHLLIEELLLSLVCAQVKYPEAIRLANFNFYTLASIAKALHFEVRFEQLWDAIFRLNALRNSLAHSLESEEHEKRLRTFALAASGGDTRASDQIVKEPARTMVESIEFICGYLIGLVEKPSLQK